MTRAAAGNGWVTASVFGLVVMATWTLVIKFLAPALYVVAERAAGSRPAEAPVMWDFWWVAHLLLAWLLWRRHPRAVHLGTAVAAVETLIVSTKLALYAGRPDLSLWGLLWLTNKMYVLAFFAAFLVLALTGRLPLRAESYERA
jgi:hypothetical protein